MPHSAPSVECLACEIDIEMGEADYRFLVNGHSIKYVSVAAGVYDPEEMSFMPTFLPQLPIFPPGDWNVGHISKSHGEDPAPTMESTSRVSLPSIQPLWHPRRIEFLDLSLGKALSSHVYEATSPELDDGKTTFVAKFARFTWEVDYYRKETEAYSWIDGTGVGPAFLGHIQEYGRTIGFLLEKLDGRVAGPRDIDPCRLALRRLHDLNIKHGDVNRHNFVVNAGRARLVDFETAVRCSDEEELEKEAESLGRTLADESRRGGMYVVEQTGDAEVGRSTGSPAETPP